MPNSKPHYRRGVAVEERKYSKGKLVPEKSMSFHGRGALVSSSSVDDLRRPRTVPDLLLSRSGSSFVSSFSASMTEGKPKLTKLLLNVTIQGSLGAVQVLITLDSTVGDLISAAMKQYVKEGRRPVLPTSDSSSFDLHYSQFSLEIRYLYDEREFNDTASFLLTHCFKQHGLKSPTIRQRRKNSFDLNAYPPTSNGEEISFDLNASPLRSQIPNNEIESLFEEVDSTNAPSIEEIERSIPITVRPSSPGVLLLDLNINDNQEFESSTLELHVEELIEEEANSPVHDSGVEIKGNKPVEVEPELGQYVRLSQATLGEIKKGCGNVTIFVKIGDQKLVLGRLHPDKFPQLSFDLVFEKTFELSHDWKDGSVHLCGFLGDMEDEEDDFPGFDSSEEEEEALEQENGGTLQSQAKKPVAAAAKPKEDKVDKEDEDEDDDDDEDDEDDDSSDEDDESDDEEILAANGAKVGEDETSDEDSSDEEDEAPAKPVESQKKRPAPAAKTPEAKKSKAASPKSTGGKSGDKFKPQTPKSAGKKFNNGNAFQSQKKGKHSAGK